ncbi:MAG TPA: hypothetical protein VNJ53_13220 [Gaiellaceae bacterium]|nr:hypothetical protein [Gaiellaceae bacterium]
MVGRLVVDPTVQVCIACGTPRPLRWVEEQERPTFGTTTRTWFRPWYRCTLACIRAQLARWGLAAPDVRRMEDSAWVEED